MRSRRTVGRVLRYNQDDALVRGGSDVLYQTDVSGNNRIDYIFMGGVWHPTMKPCSIAKSFGI